MRAGVMRNWFWLLGWIQLAGGCGIGHPAIGGRHPFRAIVRQIVAVPAAPPRGVGGHHRTRVAIDQPLGGFEMAVGE